jgi:hypothetical protein
MTTSVKIELPLDAHADFIDVYIIDRAHQLSAPYLSTTISRGASTTEYVHSTRDVLLRERFEGEKHA